MKSKTHFFDVEHMELSINVSQNRWIKFHGKSHLEMDDDWGGYPHEETPPHLFGPSDWGRRGLVFVLSKDVVLRRAAAQFSGGVALWLF